MFIFRFYVAETSKFKTEEQNQFQLARRPILL